MRRFGPDEGLKRTVQRPQPPRAALARAPCECHQGHPCRSCRTCASACGQSFVVSAGDATTVQDSNTSQNTEVLECHAMDIRKVNLTACFGEIGRAKLCAAQWI